MKSKPYNPNFNEMRSFASGGILSPMPPVKSYFAHAAVFILMLVVAVATCRVFGWSTDVIRAVPLLYFVYIAVVFIYYGLVKRRKSPEV